MNKYPLMLIVSLLTLVGCQEKAADTATKEAAPVVKAVADTAATATKAVETKVAAKADDDEESGMALFNKSCQRCHGEGYFPKKDSKMTSYDGLHKMVGMCDAQLGTEMFPEELQKITDYLNDEHYKFKK